MSSRDFQYINKPICVFAGGMTFWQSSILDAAKPLQEVCEAVGYKFAPDWEQLAEFERLGIFCTLQSMSGGVAAWQLSPLLFDPRRVVACQVALWEPSGPRRGERYVRLLRESERVLAGRGVREVVGVSKIPPKGALAPVFRRIGWMLDEQLYIKTLSGGG